MADYDYSEITAGNCPHRWAIVAKHLEENDTAQLAALDSNYKSTLEHVYNEDFTEIHVPEAPTNFTAVDGGDNEVDITWDAVTDADSYTLYWIESPSGETAAQIIASPDGSATVTLPGGDSVVVGFGDKRFTMTATDTNGESVGSTPVNATITAP